MDTLKEASGYPGLGILTTAACFTRKALARATHQACLITSQRNGLRLLRLPVTEEAGRSSVKNVPVPKR